MRHDADRVDFVNAGYGRSHDTALGTCKKRWLELALNCASFVGSEELQLDMPHVCCPPKREYVANLWTLHGLLDSVSGFTSQADVYTVLERPYTV